MEARVAGQQESGTVSPQDMPTSTRETWEKSEKTRYTHCMLQPMGLNILGVTGRESYIALVW